MTGTFEDGRTAVRDDERETVRASVDVVATPDAVFRALVEPRERAAWLGGGDPRDAGDASDGRSDEGGDGSVSHQAHPGARWHSPAIAPDGTAGTVAGEYLHVAPPRRLDTTWRASWNDFAPEHVRFELVPIEVDGAPGTRVTVTHTRLPRGATTTARLGLSSLHPRAPVTGEQWSSLLTRLAAHAAARSLAAHWTGDAPDAHWFDALHRAVVAAANRPR
jgi:uncharacterized protein YndB with AHSA1/START domain